MSADDLRLEEPQKNGTPWVRTVLLMVLPLAAAWAVAFWVTGLLWWDAAVGDVTQVPPPEPAQIESVDADRIDLDRYTRARPYWTP